MTEAVLIVDDSLTVRMDLVEAFEAAGFRPIACATAAEAREALKAESIRLIILDVVLPDMDGVDLLRELRTLPAELAPVVLMLSTEADVKDRIRGLHTGADEYVGKPYDSGYVVAKARELLYARVPAPERTPTALLIDDSVTFRTELRAALEATGYSVITASSGEEGLRIAADQRPAVIVVDGVLPGIDGATVIRSIRLDAALRGVPCILLTASTVDKRAEIQALDAGADAFVRKEEEIEVILAKLAAVVRLACAPSAKDETSSILSPKRVLAVDDSVTYLEELGRTLREEGYDLVLAHSGEEALDLLAVQPVDCILLDSIMPGLSGEATCRRIKSAAVVRDIPLIMLTSRDDRDAMIQGLSSGADDYISKSSEFDVLKARLRAQIRRKQFEDENRHMHEEMLRQELETAAANAARELAETRAKMVEELAEKNRELEAFTSCVSHDLRGPLRIISGFSQILLEDHANSLNEEGVGYLLDIVAEVKHMAGLVDDLLRLSQVTALTLECERVDLSQIARLTAKELQCLEPSRNVAITIADGLYADADARLLGVLIQNILGNAWKFTAKTEAPQIEIGSERQNGEIVYFIRDNGAGFDMKYSDKLFAPFQRLHHARDFPGTGVGLATVHRIIEKHGGRVWAEGAESQGATFFFVIPSKG